MTKIHDVIVGKRGREHESGNTSRGTQVGEHEDKREQQFIIVIWVQEVFMERKNGGSKEAANVSTNTNKKVAKGSAN